MESDYWVLIKISKFVSCATFVANYYVVVSNIVRKLCGYLRHQNSFFMLTVQCPKSHLFMRKYVNIHGSRYLEFFFFVFCKIVKPADCNIHTDQILRFPGFYRKIFNSLWQEIVTHLKLKLLQHLLRLFHFYYHFSLV